MPIDISVLAVVVFLVPMGYLFLASPAFLLVRLDIPEVAYIFRSVFFGYFVVLVGVGLVATTLFALDGLMFQSLCIGLITVFDTVWRHRMMRKVDALLVETQAGLPGVGGRLRRLHWAGMVTNAVQLATVLAFIPVLVATTST